MQRMFAQRNSFRSPLESLLFEMSNYKRKNFTRIHVPVKVATKLAAVAANAAIGDSGGVHCQRSIFEQGAATGLHVSTMSASTSIAMPRFKLCDTAQYFSWLLRIRSTSSFLPFGTPKRYFTRTRVISGLPSTFSM